MLVLLHTVVPFIFPLLVLIAALQDVTSYTISNRLSIGLALAFIPSALIMGMAPGQIGLCLLVGAAALAAGVAMFAMGWIGGGDAKLFAASALWLGWPAVTPFLAWTSLAGGGLAVVLLLARQAPITAFNRTPAWVARLLEPKGDVPYGVAIAVGALIAFPASSFLRPLGGH
jgi:prepilin peptidase CpaA